MNLFVNINLCADILYADIFHHIKPFMGICYTIHLKTVTKPSKKLKCKGYSYDNVVTLFKLAVFFLIKIIFSKETNTFILNPVIGMKRVRFVSYNFDMAGN